jgi:hypothetical protein
MDAIRKKPNIVFLLTLCVTALLAVLCQTNAHAEEVRSGESVLVEPLQKIGLIRPRHSKDIQASNWSVGAETMDRDMTIYDNWKQYLGSLGVKKARIQSGWQKTERERGKFDWAWLDAIVRDMVAQGVEPWMTLCYGNTLYPGSGSTGLGSKPPSEGEPLAAWCRYVDAVVARYGDVIDEWEVWNEPKGGATNYAPFLVATSETIRKRQPKANIIACATVRIDIPLATGTLDVLKNEGKLDLVNEVTYHPYSVNPDDIYGKVAELRRLIFGYSKKITIRQGENGAPSQRGSFGAIADYDWTETRQAKWALRRLLGDLGRDIPSSYFSICDMDYGKKINYKGLLKTNADKTVDHPKQAYAAVQHLTAVFDNSVIRIDDFNASVRGNAIEARYEVFGYRTVEGSSIITVWRSDKPPTDAVAYEPVTLELPVLKLVEPVWVDLRTGEVCALPKNACERKGERLIIKSFPVYDSVVLLAEKSALSIVKGVNPFPVKFGLNSKESQSDKERAIETE